MLVTSLECTFRRSWFWMYVNWAVSKLGFKCQAFSTFWRPKATQHTQILLKFGWKRKDMKHYNFFNYQGWTQHTDITKCWLSIISISSFKNFLISCIILREICIFVCCILKKKCSCFLRCFLLCFRLDKITTMKYYLLGS